MRFLRAYRDRLPDPGPDVRALVADVAAWRDRRLAEWAGRDRSDSLRYPLKPR
jgi:hypothetical protein